MAVFLTGQPGAGATQGDKAPYGTSGAGATPRVVEMVPVERGSRTVTRSDTERCSRSRSGAAKGQVGSIASVGSSIGAASRTKPVWPQALRLSQARRSI